MLAGFDKAAAELYARLTPVPSTDNKESLIAMIDAVGAKPLTITLEKLSFKYNEVPFQAQGRADIQPFKYAELLAGHGAEKLQAELSIQLGKYVTEVLPQFAPMLEQYVQMGMIEQDEDGAYKSQVQFNRKQLRANDNVVQQF
ncbi:hypothetical protein CA267_018750 [Alteromonas pelagimontana]|uniref:Uncharacterized protein n=1 Tax=Alteromonas pelagimontana TaxID=1858656 RepID=A0A6M4MHG9_9ALTE|nr:hypothetical protein [Alteromonas pelagimontana]QJR82644.1 hypothetical protein CA267_018750 [Alteromonas pelagimontana]